MPVGRLEARDVADLRASPLTYEPVGASGAPPPGYHQLRRSVVLKRRDFDGATADLLTWRVHDRAGLRVRASEIPLEQGTVVLMRLGFGALSLKIPCRVVDLIDEPGRRGFVYGTLPGHPEAGEEQFLLEQHADGRISFTIAAYAKPASPLAKFGGPASRLAQLVMTKRYLTALDRR